MVPGGAPYGLSCIRTPGTLRPEACDPLCSLSLLLCHPASRLLSGLCLHRNRLVSRHPGSLALGSYLVLAPCQGGEHTRGSEAQMGSLVSG